MQFVCPLYNDAAQQAVWIEAVVGDGSGGIKTSLGHRQELEVANILASVYVPMATRCLFLRKGKEMHL
eukprot:218679-Amphidinium_carterae.1